jgi:endoglucanase
MIDLLKQLCEINGASGDEERVARYIIDYITTNIHPESVVVRRDTMGNLLVYKKGRHTPEKTVMFAAHMDEVGFIITDITKDGFLRFEAVGGINAGAVFGRRVLIESAAGSVPGVIAGKPVHLLTDKEKDTQPKIGDLLIDIGTDSREQAAELVKQGDFCYFVSEFEEIENYTNLESNESRLLRAKAIDNRLGCAVALDLMKQELNYDCVFAFTVQEEIGCRGAGVAAYNLEPDICIVLEATTACDVAGVSGEDKVCKSGEGPVVSFMDKGTVYDRELYRIAVDTARENNMKVQTKTKIVGGNDASVLHKTMGGIRTVAVCAPCRYLHTANSVVNSRDLADVRKLAEKLLYKLAVL